jgi:hypothetical protein
MSVIATDLNISKGSVVRVSHPIELDRSGIDIKANHFPFLLEGEISYGSVLGIDDDLLDPRSHC